MKIYEVLQIADFGRDRAGQGVAAYEDMSQFCKLADVARNRTDQVVLSQLEHGYTIVVIGVDAVPLAQRFVA